MPVLNGVRAGLNSYSLNTAASKPAVARSEQSSVLMGRGDRRTKRGKRKIGSFGVYRPTTKKKRDLRRNPKPLLEKFMWLDGDGEWNDEVISEEEFNAFNAGEDTSRFAKFYDDDDEDEDLDDDFEGEEGKPTAAAKVKKEKPKPAEPEEEDEPAPAEPEAAEEPAPAEPEEAEEPAPAEPEAAEEPAAAEPEEEDEPAPAEPEAAEEPAPAEPEEAEEPAPAEPEATQEPAPAQAEVSEEETDSEPQFMTEQEARTKAMRDEQRRYADLAPEAEDLPLNADGEVDFAALTAMEKKDEDPRLLGKVVSVTDSGLVGIQPRMGTTSLKLGTLVDFSSGGSGVLMHSVSVQYFAAGLDGATPKVGDQVMYQFEPEDEQFTLYKKLKVRAWNGEEATWGGVYDYLGRPIDASAETESPGEELEVFQPPIDKAGRRSIAKPMHTGVLAIEALTPIGRGQSMMIFGPDTLPTGSGRSDLAFRILLGQKTLNEGLPSVLVLAEPNEAARKATLDALKESGVIENTRVLVARTPLEALFASQCACSVAQARGGDDILVVIDSLRPQRQLWLEIVKALADDGIEFTSMEFGSKMREYYAALTERTARRRIERNATEGTTGGSISMILLQPSVTMMAEKSEDRKDVYTLDDFKKNNFTQKVCDRIKMLESKNIEITQEILTKLGIPAPGSSHPVAGKGQVSQQHLEELTSLVDGHIELRESMALSGASPPIDPTNSLTRIGIGSTKLRPTSISPIMDSLTSGLRFKLCEAMDPANVEHRDFASYRAVMQQSSLEPLTLGEEVVLMLAAKNGLLDAAVGNAGELGVENMKRVILKHVSEKEPELLEKVTESGLMSDEAKETVADLISDAVYFPESLSESTLSIVDDSLRSSKEFASWKADGK